MKVRLSLVILMAALAIGAIGCSSDPFACCDRRASLADWFDSYGPTGCHCPDGCCEHR